MKKLSVCIILALYMCLAMAFPAGAVVYKTELSDLKSILNDFDAYAASKKPSGYDYKFVCVTLSGGSLWSVRVYYSNKSTIGVGSSVYWIHTANPSDTKIYDVGLRTVSSFSWIDLGFNVRFTDNSNQTSTYYVQDLSTASIPALSTLSYTYDYIASSVPPIDITALQSLIVTAKAKTDTGYTDVSWQALQSAIAAAENLLKTTGYTQSQVDSAKNTLQAALDGLALPPALPDTNELIELLIEADKIDDIGYTAPTWTRFDNARASGHSLLARPSYTEPEVSATTIELSVSMNGLTLQTIISPPLPTGNGFDLGTGEVSGYLVQIPEISSNYIVSIYPVVIGIFSILFSIKIIPLVFKKIFRGFKR